MSDIEKFISPLIQSQFPAFYKDDGPTLIAFIQAYYEWLESGSDFDSGQTLYHGRRILDYADVDTTVTEFLTHFQKTYLYGLDYNTATDKPLVVKRILDLYRTKGTPRAIKLLFRIVYGVDVDLYYPGQDIFKSSDNIWYVPNYLEVSTNDKLSSFVGQTVVGIESGASAFVDSLITRQFNAKYSTILYISNIKNVFKSGEIIRLSTDTTVAGNPHVVGSLTYLSIAGGGSGFAIGEIVDLISVHGISGRALVTSISNVTGIVAFSLIDGGFGYTANSTIYVSQKVLGLQNVQSTNTTLSYAPFDLMEQITFVGANSSIANATANVIGTSANATLYLNAITGTFLLNETISIGNNSSASILTQLANATVTTLNVGNRVNNIYPGSSVIGSLSGATANLLSYDTTIGVISLSTGIDIISYPTIVGNGHGTSANLGFIGFGTLASVNVAQVSITDNFYLNIDYLSGNNVALVPYVSLKLNGSNSGIPSNGYGFPLNPAANISSAISASLTYQYETVGYISAVGGVNPGSQYNYPPFVLAYNPTIAQMKLKDYNITVTDTSQNFNVGEIVTQNVPFSNLQVLTVNSTLGFRYNTIVYENNGSANIAVGQTISIAGNNITVQTLSGAFIVSNTTDLMYGSNVQYVSAITVGSTPTAYNNTDYITVSNGVSNATATFVTNSTGGFATTTVSNGGYFLLTSTPSNVLVSVFAANGSPSLGNGATLTTVFTQRAANTGILAVNNTVTYFTAEGAVLDKSLGYLHVKRLTASQSFVAGIPIYGQVSGASSNVSIVTPYANAVYSGENAIINAAIQTAAGDATALKVFDSGYGYVNSELLTFISESNSLHVGQAQAFTGNGIGSSTGYYRNTKSFLDADKYIQDGNYYQDFSYEIRSPLDFNKYQDMVKKVVHMAGTRLFGAVYNTSEIQASKMTAELLITHN